MRKAGKAGADVVAFLAGPDRGWLAGQNVRADGGGALTGGAGRLKG